MREITIKEMEEISGGGEIYDGKTFFKGLALATLGTVAMFSGLGIPIAIAGGICALGGGALMSMSSDVGEALTEEQFNNVVRGKINITDVYTPSQAYDEVINYYNYNNSYDYYFWLIWNGQSN